MSGPSEVLVQVADLRGVASVSVFDLNAVESRCLENLLSNIPEPEWEPTDDMVAKYRRAINPSMSWELAVRSVKAMHREGLL